MSVIEITEAKREGARLVIGIAGISGSGKTYTALQLAYGLANGDGRKVGFLDTENRRARLYASDDTYGTVQRALGLPKPAAPFQVGDLYAPFSPQRYIDAILAFQQAGVDVLVIDSVTHEWEGPGGCEDIANAGNPRLPDWRRAKAEHKRFVTALLQSDMHVIVCIRAREKVKITNQGGKTLVEPLGVQPIAEKNFLFEMTASMLMWAEGQQQEVLKCPAELRQILGRGEGYITAADGRALRQWVDGAHQLDPEVEHHRNSLRTITEQGMVALEAAWKATPASVRKALGPAVLDDLKAAAQAFDKQREVAAERGGNVDDLNKEIFNEHATP